MPRANQYARTRSRIGTGLAENHVTANVCTLASGSPNWHNKWQEGHFRRRPHHARQTGRKSSP